MNCESVSRALRHAATVAAAAAMISTATAAEPIKQVAAPPVPAPTVAPTVAPSMAPVAAPAAAAAVAGSAVFPALQYAGTVAGDELYTAIKSNPRFAKLDKELVGSPIALRVTHSFAMSAGGKATGLASAILAGSTLGLLPLVTNGDLIITYEMVVNGTVLSTYAYQKNFTRSQNLYSTDTTYGLGKEGLAWSKTTVDQFLADAAKDTKLDGLLAEYQFYFGTATK